MAFFHSLDNTMDQKNFKEWAAPKPLLGSMWGFPQKNDVFVTCLKSVL